LLIVAKGYQIIKFLITIIVLNYYNACGYSA